MSHAFIASQCFADFDFRSDQEVSQPFHNLPARKLTDYYALIRTPESLKRIEKKVRGVHGRNDPTGISDFKTWRSFEEHVSLIWRNAREYNEDGSEISNLADNLEVSSCRVCLPRLLTHLRPILKVESRKQKALFPTLRN